MTLEKDHGIEVASMEAGEQLSEKCQADTKKVAIGNTRNDRDDAAKPN